MVNLLISNLFFFFRKSKKDDATRAASVGTLDLKPQPPKKEKEKGICDLL